MYLETGTVVASGVGAVLVFTLMKGYTLWRRWSNQSKINDELDMDKLISDAIKSGNTELIAKLRKYFLTYKPRSGDVGTEKIERFSIKNYQGDMSLALRRFKRKYPEYTPR